MPGVSMKYSNSKCTKPDYYHQLRRDVLRSVPESVNCVLSVGCGAGVTEAELVKRGAQVVGVELNHLAAQIAKQRGVIVLEGDASQVDVGLDGKVYDCIIYADILEHLPEPLSVLKKHIKHLKEDGLIYVSVPNFRHYSVFWRLFVQGYIHYEEAGIFDRTHLRITTRRLVLRWFEQLGLRVVQSKYIIYRRRDKLISALSGGLADEFVAVQIGLVAKK